MGISNPSVGNVESVEYRSVPDSRISRYIRGTSAAVSDAAMANESSELRVYYSDHCLSAAVSMNRGDGDAK